MTYNAQRDGPRIAWAWAIERADAGDFAELERLILAGEPVPGEFRQTLADFATGKRKPKRARGQKRRVTEARARQIREAVAAITTDDAEIGFRKLSREQAFEVVAEAAGLSAEAVRDVTEQRKTYRRKPGEK
jgi:hypothetical protein